MNDSYALITGATSGIGYELAKRFADEKKNVIIVARKEDRLEEVRAELATRGVDVQALSVDLMQPGAATALYQEVRAAGWKVDTLVNNAGQGEHGQFVETDLHRQVSIIQLNVVALVELTHHFMKEMLARNEGRILQVGSVVSKMPSPLLGVYGATKAFVLSFSEALINELQGSNVTMTVLMPGATDTAFFARAHMEDAKIYAESKLADPAKVAADGYAALMSGKSSIVSGLKNKIQTTIADLSPHTMNARANRALNEDTEKDGDEIRTEPTHEASKKERDALEERR